MRKIVSAVRLLGGVKAWASIARVVAWFWGLADTLPVQGWLCQDLVRTRWLTFIFPLNVRWLVIRLPAHVSRLTDGWVCLCSCPDFRLFDSLVRLFQEHLLLFFGHYSLLLLRRIRWVDDFWGISFLVSGYLGRRILDQISVQILMELITFHRLGFHGSPFLSYQRFGVGATFRTEGRIRRIFFVLVTKKFALLSSCCHHHFLLGGSFLNRP